jgi:teichuronic acid exporter
MDKIKLFFWSFINTGGSQIVAFAASMAIARIAGPEEFGVFAIAGATVMVANIFAEAGFSSTIVYDDVFCEEKASTILWMSAFASIFIFLILLALAQPLATFFEAPRLQNILPFMAVTCIATSLGNAHAALIARNLQFKKKAMLALSSNIIAVGVGLFVAFSGYPLAGLTAIFVLTPLLLTAFMWALAPWSVRFVCKPSLLFGDIAFATNIAISSFLDQFGKSSVTFFLGQRFDIATVGYFSRAEAIKNIASQTIDKVVQRVAFPVLSRARISDLEDSIASHLLISQALMFILLPLCWFVHKFAGDIIWLLFGPGWEQSAPILEISIIGGFCLPLASLNLTLLKSNGRTIFMLLNKGMALLFIFAIFLFGEHLGILSILKMLVTVFALQLIVSIASLAWLPDFRFAEYLRSTITTLLAISVAIAFYEVWAKFDFRFIFANLLFHGMAIFVSVSLAYFFASRFITSVRANA